MPAVKLIAEDWDAEGVYQVGTFPSWGRWAEWNAKFRDDIRCFVKGEPGIVSSLANVIATLVVRMKGVDAIRTADDAKFSIGLRFLVPEEGALVKALLASVDFFAIWSFVLVVMGLMHLFEMTRRQAIYCIIPMWIIYVGMLLLGEVTGSFG